MKTYKVKSNLKYNGKHYKKGDTVELEAVEAEKLLSDKVVVMLDEDVSDDMPETPQPAVNKVNRKNGETAGEAEVEPGKETQVDPNDDEDKTGEPDKSEYRVLRGIEYPKGTVHKVGDVLMLTSEQAGLFAEGLIEPVGAEEDSL